MASRSKVPTEFGGVPGRIAPLPHPLTAAEASRLERATHPANPADTPEAVLIREWETERRL